MGVGDLVSGDDPGTERAVDIPGLAQVCAISSCLAKTLFPDSLLDLHLPLPPRFGFGGRSRRARDCALDAMCLLPADGLYADDELLP